MRKIIKIKALLLSFVFLTGFVPVSALFGPAATIVSTGNFYKAGLQLFIDQSIQKKTGKNSLVFFKEEIEKQNTSNKLNEDLRKLVEERIKIARQKIEIQNINR
tara:strand:- start:1293 stop:1604 length:312 start_codon:yes stop_codon:yes gene_type:complete